MCCREIINYVLKWIKKTEAGVDLSHFQPKNKTCLYLLLLCVNVQLHRHDLSSKDRGDGPQCSAAPPGNHCGLPERPGCISQAVSLTPAPPVRHSCYAADVR